MIKNTAQATLFFASPIFNQYVHVFYFQQAITILTLVDTYFLNMYFNLLTLIFNIFLITNQTQRKTFVTFMKDF
ncbi:hypothetical protein CN671_28085 [Bacillus toyonensis]|nr:hypothetical protein CN671_28085 [Bacillus toyonensis]